MRPRPMRYRTPTQRANAYAARSQAKEQYYARLRELGVMPPLRAAGGGGGDRPFGETLDERLEEIDQSFDTNRTIDDLRRLVDRGENIKTERIT